MALPNSSHRTNPVNAELPSSHHLFKDDVGDSADESNGEVTNKNSDHSSSPLNTFLAPSSSASPSGLLLCSPSSSPHSILDPVLASISNLTSSHPQLAELFTFLYRIRKDGPEIAIQALLTNGRAEVDPDGYTFPLDPSSHEALIAFDEAVNEDQQSQRTVDADAERRGSPAGAQQASACHSRPGA